jgi:hypothetical protein
MTICKQRRRYNTMSIAAGAQIKIQECGEEATEKVVVNGEVHDMCRQCSTDAVNEYSGETINQAKARDAAQLRHHSEIMASAAEVWVSHPEVATWFAECAQQLEAMAVGVLEGRL